MKTFKDMIEDLQNDEALVEKFNEEIKTRAEAEGTEDLNGIISAAAAELGYEVKKEELDELTEAQKEVLSEEELGKVTGGSSPFCLIPSVVGISISLYTVVKSIESIIDNV